MNTIRAENILLTVMAQILENTSKYAIPVVGFSFEIL